MIALMLFHADGRRFAALGPEERHDMVLRHTRYYEQVLAPRCTVLHSGVLAPDPQAATVRITDGAPQVSAGPPHPAPEGLTGYYLIECRDRDEAVRLAGEYPMPEGLGCVEIRAVGDQAPTAVSPAPPAAVWRHYLDTAAWPQWDRTLRAVHLRPPPDRGAQGSAEWWDGRTCALRVVEVETERRLTTDIELAPKLVLRLERTLEPQPDGGTRITHRYRFPGHAPGVPDAVFAHFGPDFVTELNARLRGGITELASRAGA